MAGQRRDMHYAIMALDHFVSQVHLKNFYAENLSKRKMYATRKSDLKQFPCGSEDVCRIEDGSTSQYLDEPRLIEEFIKPVEKNYNQACRELVMDKSASILFSLSPVSPRSCKFVRRHRFAFKLDR
jgi:hypothetical protein